MKIKIKTVQVTLVETINKFTNLKETSARIKVTADDGTQYSAFDKPQRTWTAEWDSGAEIDVEVNDKSSIDRNGNPVTYHNIQRPKTSNFLMDRLAKLEARMQIIEDQLNLKGEDTDITTVDMPF